MGGRAAMVVGRGKGGGGEGGLDRGGEGKEEFGKGRVDVGEEGGRKAAQSGPIKIGA
jgi:hypothetical protein